MFRKRTHTHILVLCLCLLLALLAACGGETAATTTAEPAATALVSTVAEQAATIDATPEAAT
ncbi:MAG: hypothetical protein K1X50_17625, partial [Candidatus Promineofilum sp.]|nr:hypothetical protein [Promineifilum sp.]